MPVKRYTPEQIIGKLGKAEVLHGKGMSILQAVRRLGISDHTDERARSHIRQA